MPFVLVSDLDGTLIGDPDALLNFKELWQSLDDCKLVFNTGRSLSNYRQHLQHQLWVPDVFIGAVGTEVFTFPDGDLAQPRADPKWAEHLRSGGWDKASVTAAARRRLELCSDRSCLSLIHI